MIFRRKGSQRRNLVLNKKSNERNERKVLEKFQGFKMKRDTVRDKVDTGFPDLAQWSLSVPNHFTYAGEKEELLVKVLTDEEKKLLSPLRLDAYFEMLTEKYGLEVYTRD